MNIENINEGLAQFYLLTLAILAIMAILVYPSIKNRHSHSSKKTSK